MQGKGVARNCRTCYFSALNFFWNKEKHLRFSAGVSVNAEPMLELMRKSIFVPEKSFAKKKYSFLVCLTFLICDVH